MDRRQIQRAWKHICTLLAFYVDCFDRQVVFLVFSLYNLLSFEFIGCLRMRWKLCLSVEVVTEIANL